jgi:uncharacterized protein YcaQ
VRRLACVQLDSISTVERSHRLALGARVGNYPEETVSQLMREGRIFEYWAHEACLVPIEDYRCTVGGWHVSPSRTRGGATCSSASPS